MIKDYFKLFFFLFFENKNFYIFFSESIFTYNFLKPYIESRSKKKILIFSFYEINEKNNKYIKHFYLKNKLCRELFFFFCNCKYFYSTTPDLNFSIFRRSKNRSIKYIYLQHSMFSLNAIYNFNSFLNFDAVQCISKNHCEEIKEINILYNKNIKIFKSKYLFPFKRNKISQKFDLLIAPTWSTKFFEKKFFEPILKKFNENNITFKIRRHIMSIKNQELNKNIINKFNIKFYEDPIINYNEFDYLLSDWSGIIIEYYLIKKKKSFVINTDQKVRNQKYKLSNIIPTEVMLREYFSICYEENQIDSIISDIKNKNNLSINEDIISKDFFFGFDLQKYS